MKVKTVSYVGSFTSVRSFPRRDLPEIAFLGRSNVGKSSLINTLLGRKNFARTSNTPGKTRAGNWYLVNDAFCFVDMPGYGYAKVSLDERAKWRELVTDYVSTRAWLKGVVHLLDIRHSPNDSDRDTAAAVESAGRRLCLAFNKIDKLSRSAVPAAIARHLGDLEVSKDTGVVAFSTETGAGRRELWAWILETLDG